MSFSDKNAQSEPLLAYFCWRSKSVKYFFMGISFMLMLWVGTFMLMVE